jgi:hypothetical protein
MAYQHYLQSPAWQTTRERRLDASGHRCEFRPLLDWEPKHGGRYGPRCVAIGPLDVHHRHYRSVGAEQDSDLEVLCRFHHLVRHVTRVECAYCGETVETDDETAIAMVEEAVANVDSIHDVELDALPLNNVCGVCAHALEDD